MITITGGKLTTWRRMAKMTVDRLVEREARDAPCRTHEIPLGQAIDASELPRVEGVPRRVLRAARRPLRPRRPRRPRGGRRARRARPADRARAPRTCSPRSSTPPAASRPAASATRCCAAPAWACWPRAKLRTRRGDGAARRPGDGARAGLGRARAARPRRSGSSTRPGRGDRRGRVVTFCAPPVQTTCASVSTLPHLAARRRLPCARPRPTSSGVSRSTARARTSARSATSTSPATARRRRRLRQARRRRSTTSSCRGWSAGVWQPPERVDVGLDVAGADPAVAAADGGALAIAFISGGSLHAVLRPAGATGLHPAGSASRPAATARRSTCRSTAAPTCPSPSTTTCGSRDWTAARRRSRCCATPLDVDPARNAGDGAASARRSRSPPTAPAS